MATPERKTSNRRIASGGGNGGFSDKARANAARARSEKHTRQLEGMFLSAVSEEWGEEFLVRGLNVAGLRWQVTAVDTETETVTVETTDRSAPCRSFTSLPYRAVVHSPLSFVEGEGMDVPAGQVSEDFLSELETLIGASVPVVRLDKHGKRGFRWSVVSVNRETGEVDISSSEGNRTVPASMLTIAPVGGSSSSGSVNPARAEKDNAHLWRHAQGTPWGD